MNTFMKELTNQTNFTYTENGALAHKTTNSAVYDMFAFGGAYRTRPDIDCIFIFKNAFDENPNLAMKCLFYLRDCRGGQGERRFFRVCFRWLCDNYPDVALKNLKNISEYGRWDDLIYTTIGTPVEKKAFAIIKHQLALDIQCKTPSLLAKWLPSENASSEKTKIAGNALRKFLHMTHKEYRKMLSTLRTRINVLEKLMSENRWSEIEFDKIPSRAGLIYKNAFARRDIIARKYESFAKDVNTTVNASTLYPYEIVAKASKLTSLGCYYCFDQLNDTDRTMIEKYWENLPDYLNGEKCSMMCVVDTSASMISNQASSPLNVAISLGMYCAERIGGPFKNHYISFSKTPQLIKIEGVDFVDKVQNIYNKNLCENTNINATFDLIKSIALNPSVSKEDIPKTIVIISDMQIDNGSRPSWGSLGTAAWTKESTLTEMEKIRLDWEKSGLEIPRLVYWNVDARGEANILDLGSKVSFVSGFSPIIFQSVLTGKNGYDLMLDVLNKKRYADVIA